jgi:hypothetical protein
VRKAVSTCGVRKVPKLLMWSASAPRSCRVLSSSLRLAVTVTGQTVAMPAGRVPRFCGLSPGVPKTACRAAAASVY